MSEISVMSQVLNEQIANMKRSIDKFSKVCSKVIEEFGTCTNETGNEVTADEDTISRKQAIEPFMDNSDDWVSYDVRKILESLPPSPTPSRPHEWILCTERLPEKGVDVLCCRNNKTMDIMHFNPVSTTSYPKGFSMVWDAFSWRQDNVIAWMPLPEPYKGVDA